MKNQMNISFASKFHLLNSQEDSEEIIWSCSDSSDYETTHKENSLNISNKIISRKRKRANKKHINKSNLHINFTDSQDKIKSLKKTSYLEKHKTPKSPIICQRNIKTDITLSPIIQLKSASPLSSVKIKKKLFETTLLGSGKGKSKSEGCENYCTQNKNEINKESKSNLTNIFESSNNLANYYNAEEDHIIKNTGDQKLIEKVKSYFDSHFSSQSTQHSISECETESSRSNEVEITSSLTPSALSIKLEPKSSSGSFHQETGTKTKKSKYKKNGLSYRLNSLLKKQNASFSLWHHEQFLAVNSNFIIPREEFIALQILNVNSKYGSFLLETMDSNSRKYLILINNMYINNNVFEQNAIFKLYNPFRVIDFDIYYKLVVNVCKFECTGFLS